MKPSNVLIDTGEGREHCYLADFGLSQSVSHGPATDGELLGTVDYVAPEQIRGEAIDGRADIYAFGCLLYEMLTGERPFAGSSDIATIYAHLEEEPLPASERRPELPPSVDAVLGRAMAKEPAARYDTWLRLSMTRARLSGSPLRSARPARRGLVLVALAVVAVAIAAAVVATALRPDAASSRPGARSSIDSSSRLVSQRLSTSVAPTHVAEQY